MRARRIIWFEESEDALEGATWEGMVALCRSISEDDIRAALDAAPPGIIGARSRAYWNARLGRYPAPPMPRRRVG